MSKPHTILKIKQERQICEAVKTGLSFFSKILKCRTLNLTFSLSDFFPKD